MNLLLELDCIFLRSAVPTVCTLALDIYFTLLRHQGFLLEGLPTQIVRTRITHDKVSFHYEVVGCCYVVSYVILEVFAARS